MITSVYASSDTRDTVDPNSELITDNQQGKGGTCAVFANMYMARRRIAIENSIAAGKQISFDDFRYISTGSTSGEAVKSTFSYTAPCGITHTFQRIYLGEPMNGDYGNYYYGTSIRSLIDTDSNISNITSGTVIRTDTNGNNVFYSDAAKLKNLLIHMLETHREGIVAWAYNPNASVGMHAVLVMYYDEAMDDFICADSGLYGRQDVRTTLTSGVLTSDRYVGQNTVNGILRYIHSLWYISDSQSPPLITTFQLDLNGLLDGTYTGDLNGYGSADIYINGVCVADNETDYPAVSHSVETEYMICDIKPAAGVFYNGLAPGSDPLQGKIESGHVILVNVINCRFS